MLGAQATAEAVAPVTDTEPRLTLEDAYRIQDELIKPRLANRERLVGERWA